MVGLVVAALLAHQLLVDWVGLPFVAVVVVVRVARIARHQQPLLADRAGDPGSISAVAVLLLGLTARHQPRAAMVGMPTPGVVAAAVAVAEQASPRQQAAQTAVMAVLVVAAAAAAALA